MSRPTTKVSPKSQKEDDQDSVRKARRSPVDGPLRKAYWEAVVQWSSALVCEPRVAGSNPHYTLTTYHSLTSPPSG